MFLWCLLLFPLLGAVLNGLVLPRTNKGLSHGVGVLAVLASFVCAVFLFLPLLEAPSRTIQFAYSWIRAGQLDLPMEFVIDRLSGMMLLVVTGIGSLIHIYAGKYMSEEASVYRFFAYLNLFVFMMLLLVLGNNMLVMFIGWEGVGLCSYLLIGYWYEHKPNAVAGMKAFVVNRIGDFGFLLGIFLTYKTFHTLSFSELLGFVQNHQSLSPEVLNDIKLITFCLFIGACGKSAQIPLYVWLPDAMAGPTPVSALIHAATMVTAGIYMMTRLNFLYFLAPSVMMCVAVVGGITALFAASIALVQNDIKKVLAYSTVSQLGFMVLACGVGAFDAGMFHLLTHACFKALLFLGAGSVIVAMHHKQDIQEMGGLAKYLPITHGVFLVGVLAIIGFPGFSGFFSKDEILWRAFVFPGMGWFLWGLATCAAMCTSFYMVRLLCLTFYGKNRSDEHTRHHLHETPVLMWGPLVGLAFLSVFIGYLGIPEFLAQFLGAHNYFEHYLASNMFNPKSGFWEFTGEHHPESLEWTMMSLATGLGLLSAAVSFLIYRKGPSRLMEGLRQSYPGIYQLFLNKYWVDELYAKFVVNPLHEIAHFLFSIVDVRIINGFINFLGESLMFSSGLLSLRNSGSLQRYAAIFMIGLIGFIILVIH